MLILAVSCWLRGLTGHSMLTSCRSPTCCSVLAPCAFRVGTSSCYFFMDRRSFSCRITPDCLKRSSAMIRDETCSSGCQCVRSHQNMDVLRTAPDGPGLPWIKSLSIRGGPGPSWLFFFFFFSDSRNLSTPPPPPGSATNCSGTVTE